MKTQRILENDCFFCDKCRQFIFSDSMGEAAKGIAAQLKVDTLPTGWHCPDCHATRDQLRQATMYDDQVYDENHPDSRDYRKKMGHRKSDALETP
jgi:rubredoxin